MRVKGWVALFSLSAGLFAGLAGDAGALTLTIEQNFPLNGAPGDAEGIAVIPTGPNAGIYIPHDTTGTVTVLDVATGAFKYNFTFNFGTGLNTEFRTVDVLPNGNLLIGQHDLNQVREVIIPADPGNGTTPVATLGTINFTLPVHPNNGQPFDEFEALSAFSRPSDGAVFLLLAEEGRTLPGGSSESPGEVYLAQVAGAGITGFHKLFDVPLADNFDDLSGMDVISVAFDGTGNIDLAGSSILMTDDSSGGDSAAFVLDLTGQILETLDGPGGGTANNFESLFGQPWRDAEGADYDPDTGIITVFFSTGASGTPAIVRFSSTLEVPVPEPSSLALLGLGLGLLVLRRARHQAA